MYMLNKKIGNRLRLWPIRLTLLIVGDKSSHTRLRCSQHRHQFCENWQTLAMRCHRFPFSTSSLARFRDCGLLRLRVLVLSHMLPCELHVCSYFRTISRFFPQSRTRFCFYIHEKIISKYPFDFTFCFSLNDEVCVLPSVPFEYDPVITILFVLLSTCFLRTYLRFRLRYILQNKESTCSCGTCTVNQFIAKSHISVV